MTGGPCWNTSATRFIFATIRGKTAAKPTPGHSSRCSENGSRKPRRRFQLAIVLRDDGRLIGNCGIRRKPDNEWEADIGYELSPRYWGRGYATEAARAMVDFGFRHLGLRRISSWCIADNVASARVLERLGFVQEGRLRRNEFFKGRWWDTLLYAVLAEEWRYAQESADI